MPLLVAMWKVQVDTGPHGCRNAAVCCLCRGPLSDRIGRRLSYLICSVTFLGTTLGCAFAPTIAVLVTFRALQGLAGRSVSQLLQSFSASLQASTVPKKLQHKPAAPLPAATKAAAIIGWIYTCHFIARCKSITCTRHNLYGTWCCQTHRCSNLAAFAICMLDQPLLRTP
jgi:hypothetical protein